MKRKEIEKAAADGTALYFSRHNGWAKFGEWHGEIRTVVNCEPGDWRWNSDSKTYVRAPYKAEFGRHKTKYGYLVRDKYGNESIAPASQLRGTWEECIAIIRVDQAAQDEIRKSRDESARHATAVRVAIQEEFGLSLLHPVGLLSTQVAVSSVELLTLLRSLRDAS